VLLTLGLPLAHARSDHQQRQHEDHDDSGNDQHYGYGGHAIGIPRNPGALSVGVTTDARKRDESAEPGLQGGLWTA
jgi:hypothetical protein